MTLLLFNYSIEYSIFQVFFINILEFFKKSGSHPNWVSGERFEERRDTDWLASQIVFLFCLK